MTMVRRLADLAIRPLATAANKARRALRRRGRSAASGGHAIALTREGRIVLVKLRYAPGWRLPGGGRGDGESLRDVALRELREEIGMTSHGPVRPLAAIDPSLVLVEQVAFVPRRWSWEVERIVEADLDSLPPGTSPLARRWIAAFRRLE